MYPKLCIIVSFTLSSQPFTCIGIDAEWKPCMGKSTQEVALIQLAVEEEVGYTYILHSLHHLVYDLIDIGEICRNVSFHSLPMISCESCNYLMTWHIPRLFGIDFVNLFLIDQVYLLDCMALRKVLTDDDWARLANILFCDSNTVKIGEQCKAKAVLFSLFPNLLYVFLQLLLWGFIVTQWHLCSVFCMFVPSVYSCHCFALLVKIQFFLIQIRSNYLTELRCFVFYTQYSKLCQFPVPKWVVAERNLWYDFKSRKVAFHTWFFATWQNLKITLCGIVQIHEDGLSYFFLYLLIHSFLSISLCW